MMVVYTRRVAWPARPAGHDYTNYPFYSCPTRSPAPDSILPVFFRLHNLPPAIYRLRRWHFLALAWPIADMVRLFHVTGVLHWVTLPAWAKSSTLTLSYPVLMLGTGVLLFAIEHRIQRRAAAAAYRLCPECLYPLAGDAGTCPECGRPFTLPELTTLWR